MQEDLSGFISDSDDSRAEVITLVGEVVVEHNGKVTAWGAGVTFNQSFSEFNELKEQE